MVSPVILTGHPVPGQSLTDKPGNARWESPPQFPKPEDAMNYLATEITRPRNMSQLLILMKDGVSVESLVRVILLAGFQHGRFTVDVAQIITRPLIVLLSGIAVKAGHHSMPLRIKKKTEVDDARVKAEVIKRIYAAKGQKPPVNAGAPDTTGGLMGSGSPPVSFPPSPGAGAPGPVAGGLMAPKPAPTPLSGQPPVQTSTPGSL